MSPRGVLLALSMAIGCSSSVDAPPPDASDAPGSDASAPADGGEDAGAPDDAAIDASITDASSPACPEPPAELSPGSLTFVIHVSKHDAQAAAEVAHLEEIRGFLRPEDLFMIERGSVYVDRIREMFPCNRVHIIAFPSEMERALATADDVTGVVVDWEGGEVDSHTLSWTIDRLSEHSAMIHAVGKQAGFCPAWAGRTVDDGNITRASGMDYELAQIQGACVRSAARFGDATRSLLAEFDGRDVPRERLGVEISMDSFASAPNHVDALRAANCTREATAAGVLAVYLYGNGPDQLVPYFRRLGELGVRTEE